jgi:hypothetical protein
MTVEISVNWNFVGDDEAAQVSYGANQALAVPADEQDEPTEDFPFLDSVLPLQSSVIAPGLSMPIAG